ncbi:hypothetical protein TNCV_4986121 [Trichonephila clavipes]|nr:hypothetical protein TNCV_4986121 [Trichonephila clavipes]
MENLALENVRLDILCGGIRVAKDRLRARVQVLEDCHKQLNGLLLYDRPELIAIMEGQTTIQDIRSMLPDQFNDAEYLIGLIERTIDCIKDYVNHPEVLPAAQEDFKRLHSKYLLIKIDITLFLGHIEHAYNHGITWHPYPRT